MRNQTEEKWLFLIPQDEKGSVLFLFKETGILDKTEWPYQLKIEDQSLIKAIKQNITYLQCLAEAETNNYVIAFKWIPYLLASYEEVVQSANSCSGTLCVSRCARYGCLCDSGICK